MRATKPNTDLEELSSYTKALLRQEIEVLHLCVEREAALESLDRIAVYIDMPLMSWTPDVAQPYFNAEVDEFNRRQGWPDEIVDLWRDHSAGSKIPFYTRCRFTHLPFVTSLLAPVGRARGRRRTREERVAGDISRGLGLQSLLTVPVHLPQGQVAMLTWAGAKSPASAEALLQEICVELLAVAHFTMRVLNRSERNRSFAAEMRFRLTPREWECLRLTAQGFRDADVARLANIAATTVRYHIENVVEKIGASNRTHAVAIAAQLGLLGPIGI